MTTKLVINVETDHGFDNYKSLPVHDIRTAVHKQEYLSFLDDISRYFFDLILIENNDNLKLMVQGLLDKLMPGGLVVILNSDINNVKTYLPETGWHILDTMWPDKAILVRAVSADAQPTQRKGGRRARVAAKPLL